jgi:hypothetical protein
VKSVASLLNNTNNKLQPDLQGLEKKKKKEEVAELPRSTLLSQK